MDISAIGGVNSIYALVGVVVMVLFQMWLKARDDKKYRDTLHAEELKYREDKKEAETAKLESEKQMHKESLAATNKMIETQIEQTKLIAESLNRNNEITDLNKEHIIDIAEVIDKKHKTKKATVYKDKYKQAEDKHKKKIVV